jgi:hypothetical protein
VDAAIPPSGILVRQAHDHGADTGGDGGAACPDRPCGPATADELPRPAQDRGRGDQESAAATRGKYPAEGGDHGAVAPADPQLRCAWLQHCQLQHCQLMAQDEDLDLFGGVRADV